MLFRKPADSATKGQKSGQGLGWFGRIAFDPQDRNDIGLYVDSGLTYKGLISSRDSDTVGVGFVYAQLTRGARQAAINAGSVGVGAEMALEVTYQAQVIKWLNIQPDLQFVINPGGNQDLKNALVIGVRTVVTF
jgi:porin